MPKIVVILISIMSLITIAAGQTQQRHQPEVAPEDIVRITTELVQTDVVVTDKNDQIIPDLKLEDFDLYDNGKKQDIKFVEFVGVDSSRRAEGRLPSSPATIETETSTGLSAKEVKRVVAFVVDDLTMQIEDLPAVRDMLLNYVNNKMREGDLVAIVRVVGGKGLLQQFTTDRQLLRRAISLITPIVHPFSASDAPDQARMANPLAAPAADSPSALEAAAEAPEIFSSNDETIRYFRSLSALITANLVIDRLKLIPGRKNLVLITGGIPIFEVAGAGSNYSNTSSVLSRLTDNAFRAGVVINALDPRGLRASPGVVGFKATPARSALGGNDVNDLTFGRGGAIEQATFGSLLAGGSDHLGLSTVAAYTGGVSVVNTNNFEAGLDKILAHSNGYYTLAYRPSENLDNKFHRLEVKIKRGGAKVYNHTRYFAREERTAGPRTKEEEIAAAARSPLVRTDIDVTPNIAVKLQADKAVVDLHMLIGANKLHFTETAAGTHQVSFDVVAFIFDQVGNRRQGLSETVNLSLAPEDYRRALAEGLAYSASTELPPGYYQLRAVVREASSGGLGTFAKYLEIPDLSKGKLAMSSVFLFAVDSAQAKNPVPLLALRRLNRKQDLRYLTMIYNPKMKDGKPQLRSQLIISQGDKVVFREPEQPIESNNSSPVVRVGQLGLSKVAPGRYLLTVVVTDALADKKTQTLARSIDFSVVN